MIELYDGSTHRTARAAYWYLRLNLGEPHERAFDEVRYAMSDEVFSELLFANDPIGNLADHGGLQDD